MPVEMSRPAPVGAALVVGGGIGGMQAALDLTAAGIKVYLAENKASIGGVMSQLDKTFPTMTAPCAPWLPGWWRSAGAQASSSSP